MIETTVQHVAVRSPKSVAPDAPVSEAAQHLRRTDVHVLPVLEDGEVVGIVSESDLVALVAETDDRPSVRAVMSTPMTTISPTATLDTAAERMRTAGVKQLPVVRDGDYCGLLSAGTLEPFLSRRRLDIEWCDESNRVEVDGGVVAGG
ncbi:MAG: CBS domain-containing protein [Haloferacaceae archaeon]